ncbi:hypothetical protein Tco_0573616 [Tanacetum coccineum]
MVVMEYHECLGGTSEMLLSKRSKGWGEIGSFDDVFDGAFGGVGDEEVIVGEGLVRFEEDEDEKKTGKDGIFN